VNLEEGTIRGLVELLGGGPPNAASAQGRFGEQVTFQNADGTSVDFNFSFEGWITGPARDPNLNSTLQVFVEAYIAVFDPAVGATASTWYDLAFGNQGDQSIASTREYFDFSNPEEELDELLDYTIGVTADVTSGRRSFDVFANLTIAMATNANPGPYEMNFNNTATFGIDVAPGVTYTSLSGAFLDSTGVTVVPAPAAMPLLGTAFALGAGLFSRRRARNAA
jgi:hypothetical protein